MIKHLLSLAILAALSPCAAGQNYHPFPTSNTIWAENFLPRSDSAKRIVYRGLLRDDTLINGKTYHCVYESRDTTFSLKTYLGALRDDTAARKVYFIPSYGGTRELVLFNFYLRVGDSAKFSDNYINLHQSVAVKAVDSVNIGGSFRRRIVFDYPYPTMWVEGLGNQVRGLLWFASTFPNNGCWNELACMRENDSWTYHIGGAWVRWFTNVYPDCERLGELNPPPQSVAKTGPDAASVRIVPNPMSAEGKLQISRTGIYETLRIYNGSGALTATIDVRNRNVIPLNLRAYPAGVYFYRLSGQGADILSGRFSVTP